MKRSTPISNTNSKKIKLNDTAASEVETDEFFINKVWSLENHNDDVYLPVYTAITSASAPELASFDHDSINTENKYSKFYKLFRNEEKKYGECLLCSKKGITTIIKMKNSNTSGLRRHLLATHNTESLTKNATCEVETDEFFMNRVWSLETSNDDVHQAVNSTSTPTITPGGLASSTHDDTSTENKYSKFYKLSRNEQNKYGECLLCSKKNVATIIKMKKSNTSGLRRHLLAAHSIDPLIQNVSIRCEQSLKIIQKSFDQRIVEWLALKCLPFSFFDDYATQEFFSTLTNNETFPKRSSTRDKVLRHFNAMRVAVFKTLKQIPSKFSLSVDGWTKIVNQSYYGITIHFIDDNWTLQSLPLDFIQNKGRHTGKDIANLIRDVMEEFDVKSRIQGITLDNSAANTTCMVELSEVLPDEGIEFDSENCYFRCFAHILNLGVQDTLSTINTLNVRPILLNDRNGSDVQKECLEIDKSDKDNVINKVRRLFLKIKCSALWDNKLSNCCDAVNSKKLMSATDIPTQWNSTYKMLQTAISMKLAIDALVHSNKEIRGMTITPEEWAVLEIVCSYLKPFEYLSTVLGGQPYITLPLVIVGFNMLIDKIETIVTELNSKPTQDIINIRLQTAFQAGRDKMLKHYKKSNGIYGVVLILDPRHKVETFSLTPWGLDLKEQAIKKFEDIFKAQYCPTCTPEHASAQEISPLCDSSFNLFALYESPSKNWHRTNCIEATMEFDR